MFSPAFRKNLCTGFILLLLLAAAFYDVVFLNKTFKATTANSQALPYGVYGQENNKPRFIPVNGTDAPVSEEPIYEFIKQNLKKGILPLWNPHQGCGYALIGMIEVGIFYPLNLILYLLPQIYAWDILILARLLFAGLFTFWLMQRLNFEKIPALAAAVIFMLSGPMVLLQYWTANVDILTPLLLLTLDRLIRQPDGRNIALTALTIGMTVLGGHPEHIFLVNAYGMAFFLFRLFSLRGTTRWKKIILSTLAAYVLGAGAGAVVLFPFLQNFIFEFWHGHPGGTGLLMEEQRDRALTLALPHFFQKESLTYQWTFAGWWGGYLGTLPLALAFLSLFNTHKKGLNYFFAALALIIIGKEYGIPVINGLGYLPLFNICRYAIHTPPLAALTIAILAGMGVRAILAQRKNFKKGLIFTVALLSLVAGHLFILRNSPDFRISLQASLFALCILMIFQIILWCRDKNVCSRKIIGIILLIAVFGELFLYIHRERPRRFDSFAKVPYMEFLKSSPERVRSYGIFWAFYPNTSTGFGVDDLGYFLGLVPERFVRFVNHLVIENHFRNDLRPPALRAIPIEGKRNAILDMLNVRYIIAPDQDRLSKMLNAFGGFMDTFKAVYSKEVMIFERETALPRAYVVHRAIFEPDPEKSFRLLERIAPALREGAVINHPGIPRISAQLSRQPVTDRSTVKINKYSPNEVILDADMEHAGLVVLSDAYHPDWKVFLDEKPGKIFQTNNLIRSVFVPEGKHRIKFIFIPPSFYAGATVTLFSLAGVLILFNAPRRNSPESQ